MDLSEAEEATRLLDLYRSKIKTLIFECFEVPETDEIRELDFSDPEFFSAANDVTTGLDAGDISDCLSSNVKRVSVALGVLGRLEELMPGLLNQVLMLGLLNGARMTVKAGFVANQAAIAQKNGFDDAWKKMIVAGHAPKRKDYVLRQIEFFMAVTGSDKAIAIQEMADQTGRDPDSISRVLRRRKT